MEYLCVIDGILYLLRDHGILLHLAGLIAPELNNHNSDLKEDMKLRFGNLVRL